MLDRLPIRTLHACTTAYLLTAWGDDPATAGDTTAGTDPPPPITSAGSGTGSIGPGTASGAHRRPAGHSR